MGRYRPAVKPAPASGLAGMQQATSGPGAPHPAGSLHPQTQTRLLATADDVSTLKPKTFSFDGAHPALAKPGSHYLHAKQEAQSRRAQELEGGVGPAAASAVRTRPSSAAPAPGGNSSARSFGSDYSSSSMPGSSSFSPAPGANEPSRASAEYVVRLENELASLKRSIAGLTDPLTVGTAAAAPFAAPSAHSREETPTLADHLAASSTVTAEAAAPGTAPAASAHHSDGAARSAAEDLAVAKAIFSDERLAAFEAALEAKFATGGYDSDLEREFHSAEGVARRAAAAAQAEAAAYAEQRTQEEADHAARLATFHEQNAWMDEYRQRVAKDERSQRAKGKEPETAPRYVETERGGSSGGRGPGAEGEEVSLYHSEGEMELEEARDVVRAARARSVSSRPKSAPRARPVSALGGRGGTSFSTYGFETAGRGGVDGHEACAHYLGRGPHGDGLPRPAALFKRGNHTVPRPFSFERREKARPKSISEVRMEQDLAIEAEVEQAKLSKPFRANPLPRSTVEPRYQRMLEREEMRREERKASRRAALLESERPFTFYLRAKEARRYTQETAEDRAKRRANKFQRAFKAKEIPRDVKALKLGEMEERDRRRKEEARAAAVAKLAEARLPERMEMWEKKMAAASSRTSSGSRPSSAPTMSKASSKGQRKTWSFKPAPAKEVPDFNALHENFHRRLQRAKQSRPVTAVQEFRLHEKRDAEREEERKRVVADMAYDANHLPENRWPFASLRAKVNPTPPPAFGPPSEEFLRKNETLATKLRRQAVLKQRAAGHYADKTEREARAEAERRRDARRRAAAWAQAQSKLAGSKGLGGGGMDDPLGLGDPLAGLENVHAPGKSGSGGGGDGNQQHRAARHQQQADLARETVEKVLLENNVYTYVEEGSA